MNKALLVCHAPRDEYSTSKMQARSSLLRGIPSFISLDTADHLISKREDAIYLADVIAAWASRYLPVAAETAALPRAWSK